MSRVAVLGASGFLGAALVEHLLARSDHEVVPFIHNSGNAWRVARHGLAVSTVDVRARRELADLLRGCDYVVNCTRGGKEVMLDGLRNILRSSRGAGIRRLVHISSVTVFGDPPTAERESDPVPSLPVNTYGGRKQAQDRMVAKAAASGLACTVVVPPNISGPSSDYLLALIDAIDRGEFALVDAGRAHCCLVAVENLCHAIVLALHAGRTDGSRYFITDDAPTTWSEVVRDLEFARRAGAPIRSITGAEMERMARPVEKARISLARGLTHLLSGPVRQALRRDPLWAWVDKTLRGAIRPLGASAEHRLRKSISGSVAVVKPNNRPSLNVGLCAQQLRVARPSVARARRELGYEPLYRYDQSMRAFRRWYMSTHALDTEFRDLLF